MQRTASILLKRIAGLVVGCKAIRSICLTGVGSFGVLLLMFPALSSAGRTDVSGPLVIAGNGSELPTIER